MKTGNNTPSTNPFFFVTIPEFLMHDEFHKAANIACGLILKPLVKLLLEHGISFREFQKIAERSYIDAALEEDASKENISRIAVRTGLSRKHIRKTLKKAKDEYTIGSLGLHDMRAVATWHTEPKYLDNSGLPIALPYYSESGPSLLGLLNELGSDIPPSAILKQLLASEAVDINSCGEYFPVTQSITASARNPDTIVRAAVFLAAHIETIYTNLYSQKSVKLHERQTFTERIPEELHDEVVEKINKVCSGIIPEISRILDSYSVTEGYDSGKLLGVGVYTFDFPHPKQLSASVLDGIGS